MTKNTKPVPDEDLAELLEGLAKVIRPRDGRHKK